MTKTTDQRTTTGEVAGIILAAGRSRRMGAFKPLLPFGDSTVVASSIQNLRSGGVETLVVVLGHRAEELREYLKNSDIMFAVNPNPDSEMSSSIACGVQQLPPACKTVLITPVDHPAVPADVVSLLVNEWRKGRRLVKPTWEGRGGHPVVVDLSFRDQLLQLDPNLGLKALFAKHAEEVKRLPVNSSYVARDMDTWDDYAALHRDVFGSLPAFPSERANR